MVYYKVLVLATALLAGFIEKLNDHSDVLRKARAYEGLENVEDFVIYLLEEGKALLHNGLPDYGIPPLDPLKLDSIPLNLEIPGVITNDLALNNGILTGLSNYNVTFLKISTNKNATLPFNVDIEFTFNNIEYVANYVNVGSIANLMDLGCKGVIANTLKTLKLRLAIKLDSYCNMVVLDKLSIKHNINSAYFLITGFMNDEKFSSALSDFFTKVIPLVVNYVDIGNAIAPRIRTNINKILAYLLFEVPVTSLTY